VELGVLGILVERCTVTVQQIWKWCNSFQSWRSRDQQVGIFSKIIRFDSRRLHHQE